MKKTFILFFILSSFIFCKDGIEYVPGEVIVKFKKSAPSLSIQKLSTSFNLIEQKRYKNFDNLYLFKTEDGDKAKIEDKIKALKNEDIIEYAEPNYIRKALKMPNDPYFSYQWGLNNTGQTGGTYDADINCPEGWDITTGDTSVVVAVIDSGVDYTHPDLQENMWRNPGETPNNGIDDDGNGYVDDVYGINAVDGSGNPMDVLGHGTHIAGIIGAKGNNNLGVCGINWNIKIMAVKFLTVIGTEVGGSDADAIECIDYIISMKKKGVNIIATSNSWGAPGENKALEEAIERLLDEGILCIVAAGNDSSYLDYNPFVPGGLYLPNIITVAATNHNNNLADFSNYGKFKISVGAPGDRIYSTFPGNNYQNSSGTSMATPHVTGLAALIKSHFPDYDWKKIKNLILTSGKDLTSLSDKTIAGKIIRVDDALSPKGKIVTKRLRPIGDKVSSCIDEKLEISVLNIKDALPNGNMTVSVVGTGQTINLWDDGNGFDKVSADGIYSGTWQPPSIGLYNLTPSFGGDSFKVYILNNYNFQATTYNWREITGTNLNLGEDEIKKINIPFNIKFGGYTTGFSEIYVDSNGMVSFFDDILYYYLTYYNFKIPDTSITSYISIFRDNLSPSGSNNVYWAVTGESPNREFVIEWRNVGHYNFSAPTAPIGAASFQIVFFENSSDILFNYKDVDFGNTYYNKGANASIGIQISRKTGKQYSWCSPSIENGTAILWKIETGIPTGIPDKPTNISPVNGATNISLTPQLVASEYSHTDNIPFASSQWQIRAYGFTYDNPAYDSNEIGPVNQCSVPAGHLNYSTVYFWHVRYKDSNGNWSEWSDETNFSTFPNRPPEKPRNISPANGSTGISISPVLISSKCSDPDGDLLYLARWRIRKLGDLEYIWNGQSQVEYINVPLGVLEYNKTYAWQVRYADPNNNWSEWSDETYFTTIPTPSNRIPYTPENISPYNGETNVDTEPLLIATGFSDPDGDLMGNSDWQIREENGNYNVPYWQKLSAGAITAIKIDTSLKYNKKYYWRVRYYDINGNYSSWSDETYFTTKQVIPESQSSGGGGGGGGCFIATATYGTPLAKEVQVLCQWRDDYLLKNWFGKKFVKFYYKISPPIASFIRENTWAKGITRVLLTPIIYVVKIKLAIPVIFNLLLLLLPLIVAFIPHFIKPTKEAKD